MVGFTFTVRAVVIFVVEYESYIIGNTALVVEQYIDLCASKAVRKGRKTKEIKRG